MKKLVNLLVMAVTMIVVGTSCSSDDDEFKSKVPVFSDITADRDVIYEGQEVTFTAVQQKKGEYIYNAKYEWYADETEIGNYSVVYDKNTSNPSYKIKPSAPGRLSVKLVAIYYFSGKASNGSQSGKIGNMTVTSDWYPLKGTVTLKKDFNVYPKL